MAEVHGASSSGTKNTALSGLQTPESDVRPVSASALSDTPQSRTETALARVAGRWLSWQCQLLNDVRFCAVVDATGLKQGKGLPAKARLASKGKPSVPLIVLGDVKKSHSLRARDLSFWQIPIRFPNRSLCVVMHIAGLSDVERKAADRLIQWGAQNLVDWMADAAVHNLSHSLPVQTLLAQHSLKDAAASWVDDLRSRTGALRVSVGWNTSTETQLLAVSGVASLATNRELPRAIEGVLRECCQAERSLSYPANALPAVEHVMSEGKDTIRHERFHNQYGHATLLSMPCVVDDDVQGAVLLEFPHPLAAKIDVQALQEEVGLASAVLEAVTKRKPNKGRLQRALAWLKTAVLRPDSQLQRLSVFALVTTALIAVLYPFPQYATVHGTIQGADRQVISTSYASQLTSVNARAGDEVKAGQLLAQFDHSQLQLERDAWDAELKRIDALRVQAMTNKARGDVGELNAKAAAANAELDLITLRMNESTIEAPFDGLIVSGDLDDRLGASIEAGDVLFEIASLNDYSLQLSVPEQHAAHVAQSASGKMRFAAFPGVDFGFTVDTMVPVAVAEADNNVFRLQANLQGDTDLIRPGMTGVAKIPIGEASVLSRLKKGVTEKLRYWWWSIGA